MMQLFEATTEQLSQEKLLRQETQEELDKVSFRELETKQVECMIHINVITISKIFAIS